MLILIICLIMMLFVIIKIKPAFDYKKSDQYKIDLINIEAFNADCNELFSKETRYMVQMKVDNLKDQYRDLFDRMRRHEKYILHSDACMQFLNTYENIDNRWRTFNKAFIEHEKNRYKDMFDNIDGKSLDNQQRDAVVIDEESNLVVAGAGSGKTLTISAKVKYLIESGYCKEDEILLITYTKKAANEMYERVNDKLGVSIDVNTFHKLGLSIITEGRGKRPEVINVLDSVINEFFERTLMKDRNLLETFNTFFAYYLQVPKDIDEFENLDEYYESKFQLDLETLKSRASLNKAINKREQELRDEKITFANEKVKSFEELQIANFLYMNGVRYEYEKEYPYKSDDKSRKKYRPDFYLIDYDVYLEHFGVDENDHCPQLTPIEEKKYIDDMKWKISTHKEHDTHLICTYSYFSKNGSLLIELDRLLKANKVEYRPMSPEEVFKDVHSLTDKRYLDAFKKLVATFICLFKSSGYTIEKFQDLHSLSQGEFKKFVRERNALFFTLVKPIITSYNDRLKGENAIDFNDMINDATVLIKDGVVRKNYRYIIVDEYQDISLSRFKLIKAIKDQSKAHLLCVGDDWQSIYRFAGSDVSLISKFKHYFGNSQVSKIEKTYRNSQQLIDIAGDFVMKNHIQLQKNLKSATNLDAPLKVVAFDISKGDALLRILKEISEKFDDKSDVLLLGRNNFDISFIENHPYFRRVSCQSRLKIACSLYPQLDISFMSTHSSKGIEATNVIIINGDNKRLGFPNKTIDDSVLKYVLTDQEQFPYSEERRLFYVGLTRTKNYTYILTDAKYPSIFVSELVDKYHVPFQLLSETSVLDAPKCPKCKVGRLVKREHKGVEFVGCSNFPVCDFSVNNLDVISNPEKCECGGFLVRRRGKFGVFKGCTNYPYCEYTQKLKD